MTQLLKNATDNNRVWMYDTWKEIIYDWQESRQKELEDKQKKLEDRRRNFKNAVENMPYSLNITTIKWDSVRYDTLLNEKNSIYLVKNIIEASRFEWEATYQKIKNMEMLFDKNYLYIRDNDKIIKMDIFYHQDKVWLYNFETINFSLKAREVYLKRNFNAMEITPMRVYSD